MLTSVEGPSALFQLTRVKKRELRGLKGPNLASLCHLFPFSLLPNFLSSLATPTETYDTRELFFFLYHCEIVRSAPTNVFIEASILIPIPIPTPSRAPKKNLALLAAFGFKVTCSSFSPVSSRFESRFILDSCSRFLNSRGLLPYPYTEFSPTSSPGCFSLALEVGQENSHPVGQSTLMTRNALAARNNED